ncbi:MAG: ATP-binding protein, partial [Bacteriovoracaceae bacterium]|nr:ATP-binding protein [Bacteriovoracaceae bacterium]
FELNEEMRQHFSRTIDPAHLIRVMETIYFKINPENTLIIFDEIQACPSAITSLKYFQENYPTYQIVAAGSLLGVAFHQELSFPVGKVEFLELFPLSFSEFLRGIGETQLADLLQNPYDPLICDLRSRYISHLKDYYYVGGMPAVVNEFNNNHDYNLVRSVQLRLLKSYENDFAKHISSSQKLKIDLIWKSLPAQLAQENKKFIFKKLQE